MFITSIDEMEKIVDEHPTLAWEGWDVMWYKPYPAGFLKQDGAFHEGRWTRLTRISPTRSGWKLPKAFQPKGT